MRNIVIEKSRRLCKYPNKGVKWIHKTFMAKLLDIYLKNVIKTVVKSYKLLKLWFIT